jgi:hypothetical protein
MRTRLARTTRAMRDRLSTTTAMTVEGLEVYEPPVLQVLPVPTDAQPMRDRQSAA